MPSYLGIDGGGTKTLCILMDECGNELSSYRFEGISHKQIGVDKVFDNVVDAASLVLEKAGKENDEIYTVIGVPCFGEDKTADEKLEELFLKWPYGKVKLVNDVMIGWAGGLSMKEGIHLICGTGSIAFGVNEEGLSNRCGGWSEYLDEGAGTWLGRKTIEIFFKQADGRIEKGDIYKAFHDYFSTEDDLLILDKLENEYYPYRDKLASLQKLLSDSAKNNDIQALELYKEAAKELSLMIRTLYNELSFKDNVNVSVSGGIFANGEIILEPLRQYLKDLPVCIKQADHEPVYGAVLMAARMHNEEAYNKLLNNI